MKEAGFSGLKEKQDLILSLWEERALKEVPSAESADSLALRNSLPMYLNHLAEALAANRRMDVRSLLAHQEEVTRIGKLHGADRARHTSYALTEVIFEYHILREVIFDVIERDGPLPKKQRDIIYDSIEQAVNGAAVRFSEIHADIQQKFINTLTHDLKNPITAARTLAELILRRSNNPDACISSATRIIENMNRITVMIHNLLDAGRVRAGENLSVQFVQCDLDALIREVIDEMSLSYGDRIVLNSEGALEGLWGRDALRRTVENLLDNALKYSPPKTPITISLKRRKGAVELSVHNEGPPIPENELPFLFQQYRRSNSVLVGQKAGWGLGLTLVKGVVDAHRGKVRVESHESKGTTFIVEIPFAEVSFAGDLRGVG